MQVAIWRGETPGVSSKKKISALSSADRRQGATFRRLRLALRPDLGDRPKFADALGVSPETVRLWEKGNHISDPRKRAICRLIGSRLPDFFLSRKALDRRIEQILRARKRKRKT